MSPSRPDVLFWFYKEPRLAAHRLAHLRQQNPGARVFGLYAGPAEALDDYGAARRLLDDVWVHPPVSGPWAWQHGDRMLAQWHRERGERLSWDSLFIHQWDLAVDEPLERFALGADDELVLPGVRPLDEVKDRWVWVQPWSHYRGDFDAFCAHREVRGQELLACVFILATFSRRFFDQFAPRALEVPGMLEYRLPTLAKALGYRFASAGVHPDWEDQGDPLLNGCQREVTPEHIEKQRAEGGLRVWHPVYAPWPESPSRKLAPTLDASGPAAARVVIAQVPPVRASFTPGGSQVVAQAMAKALAKAGYQITMLCGTADGQRASWHDDGVHHLGAFALGPELLESGRPKVTYLEGVTFELERAEAVLMMDRVFPLPAGARAVLVLGATDYPFAREAVTSPGWDDLVVPSSYVRQVVGAFLDEAGQAERKGRVHLLPNPVVLERAHLPKRTPGDALRLLFPHRADSGKGVDASLRLLARLCERRPATLTVTVDRSATAEPGFYERLAVTARKLGVAERVEYLPWQGHAEMGALFASADLTLCLGEAPEGFGLVSLESILAGTPALARDAGAQTHLLPPSHGCFTAPATVEAQVELVEAVATSPTLPGELERGARFIREHFSVEAFLAQVARLLAGPRQGGPSAWSSR